MRQAGRYLPEYRATRKPRRQLPGPGQDPGTGLRGHAAAAARFDLDAAILFSDILTVPDAMGLGLYFVEGEGPKFERPLRSLRTSPRWRCRTWKATCAT
jgi:uroporphyrinogen decarboxylase